MALFGVLLRAIMLLGGGGLVLLVMRLAFDPLIGVMNTHGPAQSRNAFWVEQAVVWMPAVVLAMVVIMLISGATVRRGY